MNSSIYSPPPPAPRYIINNRMEHIPFEPVHANYVVNEVNIPDDDQDPDRMYRTCIILLIFNAFFTLPITVFEYILVASYILNSESGSSYGRNATMVYDLQQHTVTKCQYPASMLYMTLTSILSLATMGAMMGVQVVRSFSNIF